MLSGGVGNIGGGDLGGRLKVVTGVSSVIAHRSEIRQSQIASNIGISGLATIKARSGIFRNNRSKDWSNINNFRNNENAGNRFNSQQWNDYKSNVNNFRNNRATEINNNIQNNFDNNFDDNWWGNCGWYGGGYPGGNPWWWWGTATLATAGTFLAIDAMRDATYQPPVYDYGVNVVYQGDDVYVDGKRTASAPNTRSRQSRWQTSPPRNPPHPRHRNAGKSQIGCRWSLGFGPGGKG